jgi:hypothetical protein
VRSRSGRQEVGRRAGRATVKVGDQRAGQNSASVRQRSTAARFGVARSGTRIASPELLLDGWLLPHLICSPHLGAGANQMRRISMATRDELVEALAGRYALGNQAEKSRILDEFVAVSGYHRKHAMRLLRHGVAARRSGPRPERRLYDEAVREALIVLWEASDRICGKRLKPLLPVLLVARRGPRAQALSCAGDTVPAPAGRSTHAGSGARGSRANIPAAGSRPASAGHARGAAAPGRDRRHLRRAGRRRCLPAARFSSWRACGRPGKREKSARPHARSHRKSGNADGLTRWCGSPMTYAGGSTRRRGGRAANCWSVCRQSIRGNTRIISCASFSAA